MTETCRVLDRCRICRGRALDRVLDLGVTPLANSLVEPARVAETELRFPLDVLRCADCGLVQLGEVVAPEVMFRDYPYSSSASAPLIGHFDELAEDIVTRYAPSGALAVELGSNDGVLLRPLRARRVRAVGVEPATNLAAIANESGLETWNEFFSKDVAIRIRERYGTASAIVGTNVFAHIDDLHAVVDAVDTLLDERGALVVEVPYLGDLLARVEYDTIYHEHLSYFALAPLRRLFDDAGMEIVHVSHLPIHGGSMRFAAARRGARTADPSVAAFATREKALALANPATYDAFASAVEHSREALRSLLGDLRRRGNRIAGHGASAKGSTLLNSCGIGRETLEFIADSTPFKQGMLSPGMHIPIVAESAVDERRPDYLVLLAWNYADAIVPRFRRYTSSGGRFIHPIPLARVLGA